MNILQQHTCVRKRKVRQVGLVEPVRVCLLASHGGVGGVGSVLGVVLSALFPACKGSGRPRVDALTECPVTDRLMH